MSLPQELLNAIVEQLGEDHKALKSCALSTSALREPSQRSLFRTLALGQDRVDAAMPLPYRIVLARMRASPHLATYVRWLTFTLPHLGTPLDELEAILGILKTLANVRCCTILGEGRPPLEAWPLLEPVGLVLIESIAQQELAELHVASAETISPCVLDVFLNAAPAVTIIDCDVDATLPRAPSPPLRLIAKLISESSTIVDLVMSPEYLARLDVQKLWVEPDSIYRHFSLVAGNLRHFRFTPEGEQSYEPGNGSILPRVAMPFLKSAEIDFNFDDSHAVLLDFISNVLDLAPTLAEICITFPVWPLISLPPATLTAVRDLLAAAAQRPRIRWRLNFHESAQGWDRFHEFDNSLRAGMPSLASTGRLIVERYSFTEEEISEWFIPRTGAANFLLSLFHVDIQIMILPPLMSYALSRNVIELSFLS
ncbi:hypothetical protein C8R46DRAFT_1206320 [Mycena filopes]|nr:hypothetical protein C8R46DRAFT_1206320 [Mycena filopes]